MKLRGALGQLTYCTNIHPGEDLRALEGALCEHTSAVHRKLGSDQPFGVGLRISARAAAELDAPEARAGFAARLRALRQYAFTINGFPYGDFHGTRVKQRVYAPDWRDPERRTYTDRLARLLAALLPADEPYGSISTVPGAFRVGLDAADRARIGEALLQQAAALVRLERDTGRRIVLALEPEPHCMLETSEETVAFFQQLWRQTDHFARLIDQPPAQAAALLRRHLGVCLDLCHAAVEFEDPTACLARLERAELFIAKVQISAGLVVDPRRPEALAALAQYRDEVYLHQVVARRGDELTRYLDLPDAEASLHEGAEEWRVHFHVPIFHAALPQLATTQDFVRRFLARHRERPVTRHLEVETYTWDVLPPALRNAPVASAIARELAWVLHELDA